MADQKFNFRRAVVKDDWNYVIIGSDILALQTEILISVISKFKTNSKSKKIQQLVTENTTKQLEGLIDCNKDLFVTDLHVGLERCLVGEHTIETGDAAPIFFRPGRDLANFEAQIDS